MKSIVAAAATIATFALGGAAFAADAEGVIQKQNGWSFEIERGVMFTVKDADMLKGLQPGDKVRVNYTDIEGEREVAKVQKVNQSTN